MDNKKFPRIACIGGEAITPSHGTGMMFARHFSKYPRSKIIDMHYQTFANQYHFQRIFVPRFELTYESWGSPALKAINQCLKGEKRERGTSLVYQNKTFAPIAVDWNKYGGPPELIYSTCFSASDFAFLHHVYRNLPKKVPIIQHFLDLDLTNYNEMVSLYLELCPAIVAVWTLTKPIWSAVSKFSFREPEMVQALQQRIVGKSLKVHRNFSEDFKPIIIGNIWSGSAFHTLRNIWTSCQSELKGLPPIQWMGHPRRFKVLKIMDIDMTVSTTDPVIRDAGFLTNRIFKKRLQNADLAIVAFSGDYVDKEHYTNYSLPSRIGDYCANGLPLVVISQKNTEPWRIVEENKIGITLDPSDHQGSVKKLLQFIQDKDLRATCGNNAQDFARRELNLDLYQKNLYPKLISYSREKLHREFLQTHFSP